MICRLPACCQCVANVLLATDIVYRFTFLPHTQSRTHTHAHARTHTHALSELGLAQCEDSFPMTKLKGP
jgi:hypothetical protein